MTIALYLRLSEADGDIGIDDKEESNSIENQRFLLHDFVDNHDDLAGSIREYVDDGYTGTNFDRPAFKRMIEDAKKGLIHVVIVKDLSRLGRDYITTGDYIEQIFPMLNVRFIAVGNRYDSAKKASRTMEFDMEVSNLINSFYSRDLSRKQRNANRVRWKNGIYRGNAPFGYMRDRKDDGKWILDPDAAKIVRMIFDKALEGMGTGRIAYYLNENNIPTPAEYNLTHKNWKLREQLKPDTERLWDSERVYAVLHRYEYTGALVMGRTEKIVVGGRASRKLPKKDWVIVEGVHEAIITKEEYKEAQAVIRTINLPAYKSERKYALKGKARCGTCKTCLDYMDRGTEDYFFCGHAWGTGKFSSCSQEKYPEKFLEGIVFHAIRNHITVLKQYGTSTLEKSQEGISESKKRMKERRGILEGLKAEKIRQYEAYADGVISREAYIGKKEDLSNRMADLEKEMLEDEKAIEQTTILMDHAKSMKETAEKYEIFDKLSADMVDALIRDIYVYDKGHIEILFNFDDEMLKSLSKPQNCAI